MSEEKKNGSLLFQLYQKFKDAKENVEKNPTEEAPDIIQEVLTESLENEALLFEPSEPVVEKIPQELRYLQPLYEAYVQMCQTRENLNHVSNIREFEQILYEPIAKSDIFEPQSSMIQRFVEKVGLQVTEALNQQEKTLLTATEEARARGESREDRQEEPEESPVPEPIDGMVHIRILNNKMSAIMLTIFPFDGGKEVGLEDVYDALEDGQIVSGVNRNLLSQIAEEGLYMQVFEVARGNEPVNGIDGSIEDCTECRSPKTIEQDSHGNVNFRNLDLYEDVREGQPICKLISPVDGKSGIDIQGNSLSFLPGKKPIIPAGKNTVVSEDGSYLLAAVDGYVYYRGDRYHVESVLMIHSNVDYSVGNIDFQGDVVIQGDVCNGFSVRAEGNITVMGMVEDAELVAGGDINIKKGMNGNQSGVLNARGEVRVSYLENSRVFAGGAVRADSVIACDIFCDDAVYLEGSRGIIIGGSITALKSVEARMIGSKSQRETSITLGETPHMVMRRESVEAELEETRKVLEKLKLNLNYLSKKAGSLPPEKQAIQTQLVEQNMLYEWRRKELESKLLKLMDESVDYNRCYIRSNMIFPITKIVIGNDSIVINSVVCSCNIIYSKEEIKILNG